MINPVRCATVLYTSGTAADPDRKHLFVLLTDPSGPAQHVLMAPVCSVDPDPKAFRDDTCLLAAGDHPFIKHDSYIAYAKCRVVAASDLVKHTESGYVIEKKPASDALVARIVAGLRKSKFTKPFARDFYQDYEQSLRQPPRPRNRN
ncbi:hypothetical protein B1B_01297 [mine drainage metagenome]|uniref:Uncharacterized protein n=1 Tax=mine drainage metagenome TaxID=410659 RepID=T1C7W0_9ZZZZ